VRANLFKILAVTMAVIAVAYVSISPIYANDFWLQAKVGETIANTHSIPRTLLFPFTEIQSDAFNAHEWLASFFFYGLLQLVGEPGLPLVQGLLGVLFFGLVVRLAMERSDGNLALSLALGLIAIWAENYRHFLRPEMLANVLLLAFWIALERYRRNPNAGLLFSVLLCVVLWANVHGSFVLAPLMVLIYWLGERAQTPLPRGEAWPMGALCAAVFLCTLVNPFGTGLWRFVLSFSSQAYVQAYVPEWASTLEARLSEARGVWIGMTVLAIAWLGIGYALYKRQARVSEVLLLLAFSALALRSVRFVVFTGIVCAYVLAKLPVWQLPAARRMHVPYLLVTLGATLTLALAIAFGNANYSTPLQAPPNVKFSEGLVLQLANPDLHGNVLNSLELGSELVYRAYPRLQPSIDSRIDSYGLDYILFQRQLLVDDRLLGEFVQRYDVRYLLLDSVRFAIFQGLANWKTHHWTVFYQDGKEVLLQRADLEFKPLPQ
jgi:hypothetical protein